MLERLKATDVSIGQLVEDLGRRSLGLTLLVLTAIPCAGKPRH
jgi:hypothetical protein